ncbi:hypothetical protein R6Q59_005650 [Mikania micrantha]
MIQSINSHAMNHIKAFQFQIQCIKSQAMNHNEAFQHQVQSINFQAMNHIEALQFQIVRLSKKLAMVQLEENVAVHTKALFDIDVENSNVCKVVDSYMARAWRAHRANLRARFKEIGGSKDPTKAKASPPYNISKEDWEYLCDMWCGATFLETAKKKVEARQNRKMDSINGSKSTIRYHLEKGVSYILHQVKLTRGVLHIGMKKKGGYPKKWLQHMVPNTALKDIITDDFSALMWVLCL